MFESITLGAAARPLSMVLLAGVLLAGCGDSEEAAAPAASEVSYEALPGQTAPASVQAALDEIRSRLDAMSARIDALEGSGPLPASQVSFAQAASSGGGSDVQAVTETVLAQLGDVAATLAAIDQRVSWVEVDSASLRTDVDIATQLAAPQPCPEAMMPVTDRLCVEVAPRPSALPGTAASICDKNGYRLCTFEEGLNLCDDPSSALEYDPTDGFEWVSEVVGSLPWFGDEMFELLAISFEFGTGCTDVRSGSQNKGGILSKFSTRPYRCCMDR